MDVVIASAATASQTERLPGPFQAMVMKAVRRLGPGCTAGQVSDALVRDHGHAVAFQAVCATLVRLEAKGWLSRSKGDPTPRRGGRAPWTYAVGPAGTDALSRIDGLEAALAALDAPAR